MNTSQFLPGIQTAQQVLTHPLVVLPPSVSGCIVHVYCFESVRICVKHIETFGKLEEVWMKTMRTQRIFRCPMSCQFWSQLADAIKKALIAQSGKFGNGSLHGWLDNNGINAQPVVHFLGIPWETIITMHFECLWIMIQYSRIHN